MKEEIYLVTWRKSNIEMEQKPRYHTVDGFRLPQSFVPEVFRSACNYKPENGEVIVSTYPKCGTTWIMQMVSTILRRGKPCETAQEYFASNLFLEMTGEEGMKLAMKPYCIKIHLPFDRVNFNPDAKYIYVTRHPADCVVSFYHHVRFFPIYFFTNGSFDTFFDLFINDGVDFNDYFDNLHSWYEHKDKPNILFLTFESMKADTKGTILKIAKFLGDEYYDLLMADDEKILKDILHFSSIDFMRATINQFWREVFADKPPSEEYQEQNPTAKNYARLMKEAVEAGHYSVGEFVRKGAVGDGKITLSEDQRKRMNEYIDRKTAQYPELKNFWEQR